MMNNEMIKTLLINFGVSFVAAFLAISLSMSIRDMSMFRPCPARIMPPAPANLLAPKQAQNAKQNNVMPDGKQDKKGIQQPPMPPKPQMGPLAPQAPIKVPVSAPASGAKK